MRRCLYCKKAIDSSDRCVEVVRGNYTHGRCFTAYKDKINKREVPALTAAGFGAARW